MLLLCLSALAAPDAPDATWIGGDTNLGGALAAGDFDGDGFTDLVVTDASYAGRDGAVFVYQGSASGLSATPVATLLGEEGAHFGLSVAAADLDADGYTDLAVGATGADDSRGAVEVYQGGPAGLDTAATTRLGGAARALLGYDLAVGDVDADGYPDLVVAGNCPTQVFHGGPAGLDAVARSTLPMRGLAVAVPGDVDGDGYDDVLVSRSGAVSVFFGGASGVRPIATVLSSTVGASTFGAGLEGADVNGDGYADLLVGSSGSTDYVEIWLGPGVSGGPDATLAFADVDGWPVRLGDLDGDGFDEVSVTEAGSLAIYRGSSVGIRTPAAWTLTDAAVFGGAVVALDIEGDGDMEIAVGQPLAEGGGSVFVSSAWTTSFSRAIPGVGFGAAELEAADLDGDGIPELVVATEDGVGALFGAFEGPLDVVSADAVTSVRNVGDVDGDGDDELGATTGLLDYTGGALVFTELVSEESSYTIAGAGDTNLDGFSDLLVTHAVFGEPTRVRLYRGGPSVVGPFAELRSGLTFDEFGREIAGGDFDGDGFPDVVVLGDGPEAYGDARVFRGDGVAFDETPWVRLSGSEVVYSGSVAALDIDADGYTDLVLTEASATRVYQGTATGFGAFPSVPGGDRVRDAGDTDGDGFGDLALFDETNNQVRVYTGGAAGLTNPPPRTLGSEGRLGEDLAAFDLDGDGLDEAFVAYAYEVAMFAGR